MKRSRIRCLSRLSLLCSAVVAVVVAGVGAGPAWGAGFLIYDLSAEALAKGSAVSASTREPAAVWFNPAALTEQGHGVSLGAVGVFAKSRFESAASGEETSTELGKFVLPTAFGTVKVHDQVALALGIFPAFAIGIEWPEDWIGREHAIKAQVQTVNMNPTVAVRLLPQLSLGVGFQAVRGSVEFINGLPAAVGGSARLGGGTWGFGANAGLLYQPLPQLGLAFIYRSRVNLDFDGRVDFAPKEPDFNASLIDQGGSASLTLPDILGIGVSGKVTPTLTLTLDVNYVFWSTYDELVIDFEREPPERDKMMFRDNHNAFTLRMGADWTTPVEGLALRAGFILDQNPSPKETLAPSLPDANRVDFGLGIGYRRGWMRADLGYLLVYFLPSDAEGGQEGPEGTYRSIANLLGLTLTASFD